MVWLMMLAQLAACAGGGAGDRPEAPSSPASAAVSIPERPTESPPEAAATVTDAAALTEEGDAHRIELVLHPSDKPCTLLIKSGIFEEQADHWTIGFVRYLATEESGGCRAGVLFDPKVEVVAEDQEPIESLEAGVIAKPGAAVSFEDVPEGGMLADYNFDAQLDLCIKQLFGAYNFSQRCWLFDAAERRFVRNAELESMQAIEIDAKNRVLKSSWRVGGPVYTAVEKRWIDTKLTTTREVLTHLGETPSGKPLPPGKSSWEVVYVRRGGKLVKQREGPR